MHIFVLLLVGLLGSFHAMALEPKANAELPPREARYPVTTDATSLRKAYANPDSSKGIAASVEGIVRKITVLPNEKPVIELQLDGLPEISIPVVFPLAIAKHHSPEIGQRWRALGWFAASSEWEKISKVSMPPGPIVLLSICLVATPTLEILADSKYFQYCAAWQRAYMPPPMEQ